MPTLVFLWTDLLLWLLVLLSLLFMRYASRRRHLREPWQRVFRSRMAVGAAVVLALFVAIGLLDSVHFRAAEDSANPGEVLSLFDTLVTPLRERPEKSYSAPFALNLYAKEMVTLGNGATQRLYPRLQYGGAHLRDAGERGGDILRSSAAALLLALLLWLLLTASLAYWRRRRQAAQRHSGSPASADAGKEGFALHWLALLKPGGDGPGGFPWHILSWMLLLLLGLIVLSASLSLKYHVLGTDKVGEDVFYQALKSIRTGLVLGTLTTLVMLPAAILLGVMAGYFRGWIDDVIQYLYTTLNSIPGVLLIAASVLMLQVYMDNHAADFSSTIERADMRLLFLCIILGVTSWTGLCRMLRGEALKIRELDYVQASQAFGVGNMRIMMRHLVPNVMHIVLITVVLDFSGLVLAEAVLAYINIGVDPSTNSWGNMINSARLELAREPVVWWSLAAAFLFMFALVLAANLFSDVVRDAFDPRLKGKR